MAVIRSIPSRPDQLAIEPSIGQADRAGLRRGADLFDAGEFWEAHEAWEEVWQGEPRPIRSFYQGLIQIAAAYHHWAVKHRPRGVQLGIEKGIEKLAWYLPGYLDVDAAAMIADAERMAALAQGKDAQWLAQYPLADFPHFRWQNSRSQGIPEREADGA